MAGASSSLHKPRRKPVKKTTKGGSNGSRSASQSLTANTAKLTKRPSSDLLFLVPSFPLASFLWPARGSSSQREVLPLILMVVGLFRWAAGLWGYSGFQNPPLHGDYEAQRHWMELTTNLPVSQWYFHDLQWWGLDYPPLTAYHSWLCGTIGSLIDPSWFALHTSRGMEDPTLKVFMRASVLVSEYVVYVPAVVFFVHRFRRLTGVATWSASVALLAILMQPGVILIDHVHFQYNTVMLGLVVASMSSMLAGRYMLASAFFVAALAFKQMALYYAFSVFAYLLGNCLVPGIKTGRFLGIMAVTLASFAALVLPILACSVYNRYRGIDARPDLDGSRPPLPLFPELATHLNTDAFYYPVVEQLVQMLHRIFPFARGIFEDKVANFWCALNLVVKLQKHPPELLHRAALFATFVSIVPPNLVLFLRPRRHLLPLAFATTAWGFFLFSSQVHEKSVLLPLTPMTLLLAGTHGLGKDTRAWVGFANMLGCWTMFPLLARVHLRMPYAILTLLWAYLLGLPPTSLSAYCLTGRESSLGRRVTAFLHGGFYFVIGAWHVLEATVPPPRNKPDLWVVLNVAIGCVGFVICYLWCLAGLVLESGLLSAKWTRRQQVARTKMR